MCICAGVAPEYASVRELRNYGHVPELHKYEYMPELPKI